MITFLKNWGPVWALEDYWTQLELRQVSQCRLLILIGVPHTSLLVILDLLQDFIEIVVFYHLVNLRALTLLFGRHFGFGWV